MRKTSLLLLGAVAGAALTVLATQPHLVLGSRPAKAAPADTYKQLNLFGDVFERVRSDYVEAPDDMGGLIHDQSVGQARPARASRSTWSTNCLATVW